MKASMILTVFSLYTFYGSERGQQMATLGTLPSFLNYPVLGAHRIQKE